MWMSGHAPGSGAESVRHMMTVITGTIKQISDGVLAHRPVGMAVAREQEFAAAGERPKYFEHGHGVRGQRNKVVAIDLLLSIEVSFHPRGGNSP